MKKSLKNIISEEIKKFFINENVDDSTIKSALRNFESVRIEVINKHFPENTTKQLYPEEYFPFLYEKNPFPDEEPYFNYHQLIDNPLLIHTVWRGIHSREYSFIKEKGYVKSNQNYNIGYEREQNLTVFSKTPDSAINYASNFAPEEYKPTKDNPNYLIQIKANQPQNGFFIDQVDEYVKTSQKIPSSQIEGVWEVYSRNNIVKI